MLSENSMLSKDHSLHFYGQHKPGALLDGLWTALNGSTRDLGFGNICIEDNISWHSQKKMP